MLVTLFTDASHDSDLVLTGWGGWVRSARMDKGEVVGGWTSDPRVKGSTQAELFGTLAAVAVCLEAELILPSDTVLIQCDNLAVENMLDFTSFPDDECGNMLKAWVRQLKGESRLNFRFKHVKGHQNSLKCTRSAVNNAVDRKAKDGLYTARKHAAKGHLYTGKRGAL